MPVVELSAKDMNWGKVVEPAWYRMKVNSIGEKPSKDGGSTNYPVEAEILFNGDNGSVEYTGVGIVWNFNSKAMGAVVGFLKCFGVEPVAKQRIDLAAAQGEILDVYVENDTWDGRLVNRVNHKYRKPKADMQAVTA